MYPCVAIRVCELLSTCGSCLLIVKMDAGYGHSWLQSVSSLFVWIIRWWLSSNSIRPDDFLRGEQGEGCGGLTFVWKAINIPFFWLVWCFGHVNKKMEQSVALFYFTSRISYVSSSTLLETWKPLWLNTENSSAIVNNNQTLLRPWLLSIHFEIVLDRKSDIHWIADGNATNRLLYASYSLAHKFSKTSVYNNNRWNFGNDRHNQNP